MRWLVIGGTGLVGRYLIPLLAGCGHVVHVVSRNPAAVPGGAVTILADVSDRDWVAPLTQNYDVVCHMAYATTEEEEYNRAVTVQSVIDLLQHFQKVRLQHFIYLGSMAVFGEMTPYAQNKLEASQAVLKASVPFRVTVLHPTGVYDADSKRMRDYRAMFEDGYIAAPADGITNIVHADDVAGAIVTSASRTMGARAEEYIINGESLSYREWFAVIERKAGVDTWPKLPPWLSPFIRGPVAKLARKLRVRKALPIPAYKLAAYRAKMTFSSERAEQDFGFSPQRRLLL